jgi:hypothetical protein
VAVDAEHKVADGTEHLSASAVLARYESFRYIETRSGSKMSNKKLPFASASLTAFFANCTCEQGSKLAPLQRLSNRELTMRRASASRASNVMRGICFAFPNRELQLLEPSLTRRKQTVALRSNRELSTNQCCGQCCGNFRLSGALLSQDLPRQRPFLTGSSPQTEIDVTCSKQTTKKFLTGSRTHIKESRICAKMNAQISARLSAQMSEIR